MSVAKIKKGKQARNPSATLARLRERLQRFERLNAWNACGMVNADKQARRPFTVQRVSKQGKTDNGAYI